MLPLLQFHCFKCRQLSQTPRPPPPAETNAVVLHRRSSPGPTQVSHSRSSPGPTSQVPLSSATRSPWCRRLRRRHCGPHIFCAQLDGSGRAARAVGGQQPGGSPRGRRTAAAALAGAPPALDTHVHGFPDSFLEEELCDCIDRPKVPPAHVRARARGRTMGEQCSVSAAPITAQDLLGERWPCVPAGGGQKVTVEVKASRRPSGATVVAYGRPEKILHLSRGDDIFSSILLRCIDFAMRRRRPFCAVRVHCCQWGRPLTA